MTHAEFLYTLRVFWAWALAGAGKPQGALWLTGHDLSSQVSQHVLIPEDQT